MNKSFIIDLRTIKGQALFIKGYIEGYTINQDGDTLKIKQLDEMIEFLDFLINIYEKEK